MPTIEERVAYLEGRMQDHSALWNELRNGVSDLRDDVNRRFGEVRTEFEDLRADMNRRFEEVHGEICALRADMDRRFDLGRGDLHRLEDKVDRHFVWLTGMIVTSMVGTMGAVIGLYFK